MTKTPKFTPGQRVRVCWPEVAVDGLYGAVINYISCGNWLVLLDGESEATGLPSCRLCPVDDGEPLEIADEPAVTGDVLDLDIPRCPQCGGRCAVGDERCEVCALGGRSAIVGQASADQYAAFRAAVEKEAAGLEALALQLGKEASELQQRRENLIGHQGEASHRAACLRGYLAGKPLPF